ncbi:MAG: ATP-binding protein [Myxococcota bacterium]|nr:ATP-binding protein [Myxococcota bacterium]
MDSERPVDLPLWAASLKQRYVSGASSLFVLHGNIHDLVPWMGGYVPLQQFLAEMLMRTKDIVAFYDVASGLHFADKKMVEPFRHSVNARRLLQGRTQLPEDLPRDPFRLFPFVETLLMHKTVKGAFVIEYAETVTPDGDVSFMGEQDRAMRVTMQRWSSDPAVLETDNIIILVTENLANLDRTVRSAPGLTPIEIGMPDLAAREDYVDHLLGQIGKVGMSAGRIAAQTAGLTNFQIESMCREATMDGGKLTDEVIRVIKRQAIEQECFGLVEFVESKHDFSVVGGLDDIKTSLRRVIQAMKKGETKRVPMGILIVGPMGTGKSFMMEAFANEIGMTTLKFKNFRDKWVGSTEGNLEKILSVVKALGNTLVIIDEGDRSIGGEGGDNDGGVDSRVTARLKEFMSDTSNRGSIMFAMMTNRPDKLDADMKRPGRFDLKMPFFPPQTEEDCLAITKALLKKNKIRHRIEDYPAFVGQVLGRTGAEIEAILLGSLNFMEDRGGELVNDVDLAASAADFIPSRDSAMMRYMELLAVFECSSRRMLPEKYRDMSSEELNADLRLQKTRLLKS